jgi:hypothetical protein
VITPCSPAVVSLSSFLGPICRAARMDQVRRPRPESLGRDQTRYSPLELMASMEQSLIKRGFSILVMRAQGPEKVMGTQMAIKRAP